MAVVSYRTVADSRSRNSACTHSTKSPMLRQHYISCFFLSQILNTLMLYLLNYNPVLVLGGGHTPQRIFTIPVELPRYLCLSWPSSPATPLSRHAPYITPLPYRLPLQAPSFYFYYPLLSSISVSPTAIHPHPSFTSLPPCPSSPQLLPVPSVLTGFTPGLVQASLLHNQPVSAPW